MRVGRILQLYSEKSLFCLSVVFLYAEVYVYEYPYGSKHFLRRYLTP